MAVGDLYKVSAACAVQNQLALNRTYWITTAETGSGATPAEVATAMDSLFGPVYKPLLNQTASYRGTYVAKTSPAGIQSFTEFKNANVGAGTGAVVALPKQVAGLIKFTTARRGRHYRGRIYIPFPGVADNDTDNTPVLGYLTRLNALAAIFIGPDTVVGIAGTATLQPIIHPSGTASNENIVGAVGQDKWATQRRRGDYGKLNVIP